MSAIVVSSVSPERWLIDRGVAGFLGHLDGVERLGERADLVDLDQNRVGNARLDALLQELRVGHEQIVADQLEFVAELVGDQLPAVPVVFGQAVLDRDDRVLLRRGRRRTRPSAPAVRFEPSDFLKTYFLVAAS